MTTNTRPWVADTLAELIEGATDRVEVRTSDAKSGARFERLLIEGRPHFLKVLSGGDDWIMRVTGNTTYWEFRAGRRGCTRPAHPDRSRDRRDGFGGWGAAARLGHFDADRGADLVPPGDDAIRMEQHAGSRPGGDACPVSGVDGSDGVVRPGPPVLLLRARRDRAGVEQPDVPVPILVANAAGVAADRAPELARSSRRCTGPARSGRGAADHTADLRRRRLEAGQPGLPTGRSDGAAGLGVPGEAAPCWDLTWYLALNAARIPTSKEETIDTYRARLEAYGVDTAGWWKRQLGLSLVAMAAELRVGEGGGDDAELAWWTCAAVDGLPVAGMTTTLGVPGAYAGEATAWENQGDTGLRTVGCASARRSSRPLPDRSGSPGAGCWTPARAVVRSVMCCGFAAPR